jgi:hypothetical protein
MDALGTILDMRDKSTCPCLKNFAKMGSAELKDLCVKAYEGQMEALSKAEGAESKLLTQLKMELKEVNRDNYSFN